MGYYKCRETPFSVGLGMHVYYRIRSKELLDCLSNLNLSITYDKTLQIQTSMANAVCKVIDENNGSFIPPSVNKEKRVFFANDNTDFKNDTPNGKGEFHGTGLIICQRYDGQEIKNVPIERSSSNKIRFQEDRFSYIQLDLIITNMAFNEFLVTSNRL